MVNLKIKRSIFKVLDDNLSQPDILILLGARQVGKSTLLEEMAQSACARGRFTHQKFFNLEFPDDLLFFSKSESEIFDRLTATPDTIIFMDEFHYVKNSSKIFKAIYDAKKKIKIVASGSSSLDIHKHLKESLAGRRRILPIYPFHWNEWKQTKGVLGDFIVYGGMPGTVNLSTREDIIEYLSQMIQTYILKDVKGLLKEENVRAFNHLLFYVAENQGQLMPVSNMAREIRVTNKTVERYLTLMEQTFVLHGLHSFSRKLSNELKKSRKYYFYDNGIRNSLIKNFSPLNLRDDFGVLYESHVFLELHKMKRERGNVELRFWRTKQGDEVDFVWIEDHRPIPIEVKSSFDGDTPPPQGLLKFLKTYPESPFGLIISHSHSQNRVENREFDSIKIKLRGLKDFSAKDLLD